RLRPRDADDPRALDRASQSVRRSAELHSDRAPQAEARRRRRSGALDPPHHQRRRGRPPQHGLTARRILRMLAGMVTPLRFRNRRRGRARLALLALGAGACGGSNPPNAASAPTGATAPKNAPALSQETHLAELRQLTFGGENAEAYWAWSGRELI